MSGGSENTAVSRRAIIATGLGLLASGAYTALSQHDPLPVRREGAYAVIGPITITKPTSFKAILIPHDEAFPSPLEACLSIHGTLHPSKDPQEVYIPLPRKGEYDLTFTLGTKKNHARITLPQNPVIVHPHRDRGELEIRYPINPESELVLAYAGFVRLEPSKEGRRRGDVVDSREEFVSHYDFWNNLPPFISWTFPLSPRLVVEGAFIQDGMAASRETLRMNIVDHSAFRVPASSYLTPSLPFFTLPLPDSLESRLVKEDYGWYNANWNDPWVYFSKIFKPRSSSPF